MSEQDPQYRVPPAGMYRVIEINTRKQGWFGGKAPEECRYTTLVGDFADWDDAVGALKALTHNDCRRQMWGERGIAGENNQGSLMINSVFR